MNSAALLEAGNTEQQVNVFRYEFLHLAQRVINHLADTPASLDDARLIRLCQQLQNTGNIHDFQRLTENENIALLQILAGAPCLVCGHEQRPAVGSLGSQPKPGMWVRLQNVLIRPSRQEEETALDLVKGWFDLLGISGPTLWVPKNDSGDVLWDTKASEDSGRTIQMLAQWARQNNFEVTTDWMMTWSAVLPRRKARLVQSVWACARNPLRALKDMHPRRQCLAMCQSFQDRRTLQSAAACVRADDVQLLRPALQDALWILCSLWGEYCGKNTTNL